jgi:hypothetical protein
MLKDIIVIVTNRNSMLIIRKLLIYKAKNSCCLKLQTIHQMVMLQIVYVHKQENKFLGKYLKTFIKNES